MKRQHGAALIMVLGMMAIITVLATQIMDLISSDIKQTRALKDLQQASWYARGSETYALSKLEEFIKKPVLQATDLDVHFPISKGMIRYQLIPLHTCLSVNSLNRKQDDDSETYQHIQQSWKNFLSNTINLAPSDQDMLLDRIRDWIDNDHIPSGVYGAEAAFYASQTPAQLPPNQDIISLSELYSFEISDQNTMQALMASLCARPGDNKLSINPNDLKLTDSSLLSALLNNLVNEHQAYDIIKDKPDAGYSDLTSFWQHPLLADKKLSAPMKTSFSMERHYYQLKTEVIMGKAHFNLISLLHINDQQKTYVLTRRYGVNI